MNSKNHSLALLRTHAMHVAAGLAVSAICLWLAVRGLLNEPDALEKTTGAFANADYRTLLPIILATGVFYWFKAWRWRLLLTPIGDFQTSRDLFPFVMIGFGFNNLLPIHLGEVVRVLMFARHSRVKVTAVATSVVLERIFDSVSVLALLSLGLALVPGLSPTIRRYTLTLAGAVAVLVILLLLYVLRTKQFIAFVVAVSSRVFPLSVVERITLLLESGAAGLSALKQPQLVAGILLLSLGNWLVNGTVIYLALWSFDLPASLLISCIVLGLTAIGAAVPSAPGYMGVIQLCFKTVLMLFTDDQAGVLAASLYYHLTEYVIVTALGLYYFNSTGVRLWDAATESETNPAQDAPPSNEGT